MNKKYINYGLVLLITFAISCSKSDSNPVDPVPEAPTANFTYEGDNIAPATIVFTNTSENATEYLWDFGDNETSTDKSPEHKFKNGGVYTVKLTVTGEGGNDSVTKTVNIKDPVPEAPTANFTYEGDNLAPASISFTNTSENATEYSWDFGDNETSTDKNPVHKFKRGGVYTVKLTVTGEGGKDSVTKTVNIKDPTIVKITKIKIIDIPFTRPNGSGWDANSGPDIYVVINGENDEPIYSSHTIDDAIPNDLPFEFTLTSPLSITDFNTDFAITIWDEDLFEDELIGGYYFNFSNAAELEYPQTLLLFVEGNSIKIELTLTWQ